MVSRGGIGRRRTSRKFGTFPRSHTHSHAHSHTHTHHIRVARGSRRFRNIYFREKQRRVRVRLCRIIAIGREGRRVGGGEERDTRWLGGWVVEATGRRVALGGGVATRESETELNGKTFSIGYKNITILRLFVSRTMYIINYNVVF